MRENFKVLLLVFAILLVFFSLVAFLTRINFGIAISVVAIFILAFLCTFLLVRFHEAHEADKSLWFTNLEELKGTYKVIHKYPKNHSTVFVLLPVRSDIFPLPCYSIVVPGANYSELAEFFRNQGFCWMLTSLGGEYIKHIPD